MPESLLLSGQVFWVRVKGSIALPNSVLLKSSRRHIANSPCPEVRGQDQGDQSVARRVACAWSR